MFITIILYYRKINYFTEILEKIKRILYISYKPDVINKNSPSFKNWVLLNIF